MPNNDTLPYRPPWWLPGGHCQTIYAFLLAPRAKVSYRRERWHTPDDDFIDVDRIDGPRHAPLVILLHGLEGNSQSNYACNLMHHVQQAGWQGAVINFRGCSGEANYLPRFYHSGDADEIDWIVRKFKTEHPDTFIFLTGVSLGGNVLLKWLGTRGDGALRLIKGAVAISPPMDLSAVGYNLDKGFNKLTYTRLFLKSLKRKSLCKLEQHPSLYSAEKVKAATTLHEFDSLVTAPLHGFEDADDYWCKASSKPNLPDIKVPTLIIHARNDPFVPRNALPTQAEVSPAVVLEYPASGGHLGFVSGRFPGHTSWLPQRAMRFLKLCGERAKPASAHPKKIQHSQIPSKNQIIQLHSTSPSSTQGIHS